MKEKKRVKNCERNQLGSRILCQETSTCIKGNKNK